MGGLSSGQDFQMTEHSPSKASDGSVSNSENLSEPSESDELIHSLGTPLTIISGYVQLLRRRNRDKEGSEAAALERSLEAIEGAVDRMKDIVAAHRDLRCSHDSGK
jgi:light-regulated signal transduction histidine kinase (bacteriophytochrome)